MTEPSASLSELRRRIDEIDDQIHDLLMRRAQVVDEVRNAKRGTGAFAPAREAQILRRLLDRHGGRFPKAAVVRIWREITAAMVGLQGPFAVAVYAPDDEPGYWDLVRDHFGVVVPIASQRSVRGVVQALGDGSATVGIVPVPQDGEADPWWRALDGGASQRLRIVARLPFAPSANVREENLEALVIGRIAQEPSGIDRSFLIVETTSDVSRGSLSAMLAGAGMAPRTIVTATGPSDAAAVAHLVEVGDFVGEADPRIAPLIEAERGRLGRITVVGGHASPLPAAALAPSVREG
jgi:chorismate mutase-like protein